MSSSHYLYIANTEKLNKLIDLSPEEISIITTGKGIDKDDPQLGHCEVHDFCDFAEVVSIGNLRKLNKPLLKYLKKNCLNIFEKNELALKWFSRDDEDFYIVGKNELLKIISMLQGEILKHYSKDGFEADDYNALKYKYWKNEFVLNLNDDNIKLDQSGLYEYSIFTLVSILKTFDWNAETLIFCEW